MRFKVKLRFTSTNEAIVAMSYLVQHGYGFDVTVVPSAIIIAGTYKAMSELIKHIPIP